jgi:hypothetical protein
MHNHGEAILTSGYLHQPLSAFLLYFCLHVVVAVQPSYSGVDPHTVLWIRMICRIRMFLGLLDLGALVRGTDPAPNPDSSIIKQKYLKKP